MASVSKYTLRIVSLVVFVNICNAFNIPNVYNTTDTNFSSVIIAFAVLYGVILSLVIVSEVCYSISFGTLTFDTIKVLRKTFLNKVTPNITSLSSSSAATPIATDKKRKSLVDSFCTSKNASPTNFKFDFDIDKLEKSNAAAAASAKVKVNRDTSATPSAPLSIAVESAAPSPSKQNKAYCVKEDMLLTLRTIFAGVYSVECAGVNRIFHELCRNHSYLSLFAIPDRSRRKGIDAYRLATNITIASFGICMLYQEQASQQTSVCSNSIIDTAAECNGLHSSIDVTLRLCQWDSTYNACTLNESFSFFTSYAFLCIVLIVLISMAPVTVIINSTFEYILLAPSYFKHDYILFGHTFQSIPIEDASDDHQTASIKADKIKKINVNKLKRLHYDWNDYRSNVGMTDEEKKIFDNSWLFDDDSSAYDNDDDDDIESNAAAAATDSKKMARLPHSDYIWRDICDIANMSKKTMKLLPKIPETVQRKYLLYIFAKDMLGRNSYIDKLFTAKTSKVMLYDRFPVSWAVKLVTGAAIIASNLYIIARCINIAAGKSHAWMATVLYAVLAYIAMDCFFIENSKVLWNHYIIPSLIKSQVKQVYVTIDELIRSLPLSSLQSTTVMRQDSFSASDHLFLSVKLARKLPALHESQLILNYRDPSPPSSSRFLFQGSVCYGKPATLARSPIYVLDMIEWLIVLVASCLSLDMQLFLTHLLQPLFYAYFVYSIYIAAAFDSYDTLWALIALTVLSVSFILYLLYDKEEQGFLPKKVAPSSSFDGLSIVADSDNPDSDDDSYYSFSSPVKKSIVKPKVPKKAKKVVSSKSPSTPAKAAATTPTTMTSTAHTVASTASPTVAPNEVIDASPTVVTTAPPPTAVTITQPATFTITPSTTVTTTVPIKVAAAADATATSTGSTDRLPRLTGWSSPIALLKSLVPSIAGLATAKKASKAAAGDRIIQQMTYEKHLSSLSLAELQTQPAKENNVNTLDDLTQVYRPSYVTTTTVASPDYDPLDFLRPINYGKTI